MGTRGAVGFILDGKTIASYNHFDSYPSFLGKKVLGFARSIDATLPDLVESVRALRLVDAQDRPDAVERAALADLGVQPANVSTGSDWCSALRDTQGDLAEILRVGVTTDDASFLTDELFCEWAYLVDLDRDVLSVYQGGSHMVASFALDELPSDDAFLVTLADN